MRIPVRVAALMFLAACNDGTVVTGGAPQPLPVSSQVATVNVTPLSALLIVGDTLRLRASTRDAGGSTLSGRVVTWSTEFATVATVSASGLVTAVAPGNVRITALSEGRSGLTTLTVVAR